MSNILTEAHISAVNQPRNITNHFYSHNFYPVIGDWVQEWA